MIKDTKKTAITLETSIRYLRGIGEKRSQVLKEIGVEKLIDILYLPPIRYIDRSTVVTISTLRKNLWKFQSQSVTILGHVSKKNLLLASSGREILEILIDDGTGEVSCVWFNRVEYFKRQFEMGDFIAVFGKPAVFKGRITIPHPEFDFLSESDSANIHTGRIVPVYPSSSKLKSIGLNTLKLRELINEVIENYIDQVEEILPQRILEKYSLVPLKFALRSVHFPETHADLALALKRLKFDELLFVQLLLARKHYELKHFEKGISFSKIGELVYKFREILPFELTEAQRRVIREIWRDMKLDKPMNRLLQGDVGSGKTIVSLIAMLIAVDNGYQSAFMAPTEILAEQHYETFKNLLNSLPVNIRLLTGSIKPKEKREIYSEIEDGTAQIVIGTHALIQEGVRFKNLGLVVIDEQHRFGVMQRAMLIEKGYNPDVLVMTATPIPRTLALTIYGDLDISIIDELPKGRKRIKTEIVPDSDQESVYEFVRQKVKEGHQAYIVFPLIDESEKLDLESAIKNYVHLKNVVFPEFKVGLVHGKMPGTERAETMMKFKNGEIQILVATTVIEVGIDIPNATIMVIKNAERFGLAQLHQLRGRIGRSEKQSYCFLIAKSSLFKQTEGLLFEEENGERNKALERLKIIKETTDGFKIAEKDLELRGPGEFFGTRQSGFIKFKFADLVSDHKLLEIARAEAFELIKRDPNLENPEHQQIRKEFLKRYSDKVNLAKIG